MPDMSKKYQLILGTFIDDEFVWHDVGSYDDLTAAYREYKKYVNEQLKYSDEELVKVWNSGRLDVELRRGNKLLNWVGIYTRETGEDEDDEKDEKAKKDKDKKDDKKDEKKPDKGPDGAPKVKVKDAAGGRVFEDERGYIVTEGELRRDYETLRRELPEEFDYTFEEYLDICTGVHGTLTEIKTQQQAQDADDDDGAGTYEDMRAKRRTMFFEAIGKEDDGRRYPSLTETEFVEFGKTHEGTDKPVPRGDRYVEIFFEHEPYDDVTYFYDFNDGKIYEHRYHVGD